ncbi:MAG: Type IV pilin [Candidatus Uhrbacteria bacterium GW2011_GWE2_40_58]|nr:MAG: Type IV pilin [Candidatus Uhrbacteria bacterium GW2011_GWF2_40_263]KKR67899.1 MAG: Type IV pilin [Candidatus Uhrbacteria bacterium GW2011_GWE2_40_58]OGL92499.1 MAG: hypothetical protein A2239_01655 [Candidatus Uhrbacteria bacterium RIFOXYA2_FULL_40_9]OGL96868.1 MAG: hypothetical protein A2332_01990 [Candidatus Uhrbacteria bacterium RIFOXYB2_FULL_41_18]HBK34536.1 hypothetical protein [Candidatus Uhrbacteria bacterium]
MNQETTHIPFYKKEIHFFPIRTVEIVTMTKNFAVMLKAGLTVSESLVILAEQSSGKLAKVLNRLSREVRSGQSLGDVLVPESKTFNSLFISSVRVGESSGTLSENLEHIAGQLEREYRIRRNIQSAMLYPMIVLIATFFLGIGIATFVLPQMVRVFDSLKADLPWSTRTVLAVATMFQHYGYLIVPFLVIFFLVLVGLLRQKFLHRFTHPILLHFPIIHAFLHDVNRARFCRSVGMLIQSGVPIQESLEIVGNSLSNYVYQQSALSMQKKIETGQSFSDILTFYPKLYPKMILRMVAVGERSGGLGDSLLYLANYYEEKIDFQAKNFSSLLEPVLLILIGLVVGFVAVSILSPIYSITSSLRM